MSIKWEEVIPGKTEIWRRGINRRTILYTFGKWVWVKSNEGDQPYTYHKDCFADWEVYDPWEDVTEECHINNYGNLDHRGHIIDYNDLAAGRYKRSEKGLHVWKLRDS